MNRRYFGGVFGTVKAKSDAAFRGLTARIVRFYNEQLFNPHWGEQITFEPANRIRISMVFQGMDQQQADRVWRPFMEWVAKAPEDFVVETPLMVIDIPARHFWDAAHMKKNHPQFVVADNRPNAPEGNFFWAGDGGQVGFFLHGYRSAWLPASLLKEDQQGKLADALFSSSRHWGVSLHFNKGLAGASAANLASARDTAMNPAVLDAFALAIIATGGPPAFPGIPGGEPDLTVARRHALEINNAMNALLKVTNHRGSYVSESDFFERSWQQAFWGSNYPRLAAVKKQYDPAGLFFVHHGVGSEEWSADGFTRLAGR